MKKLLTLLSLILIFNCSSESDDSPTQEQEQEAETNCFTPQFVYSDSNESSESIILQWESEQNDNLLNYTIEYGESGFSLGTGTTQTLNGNSTIIGNLEQNTAYDFYVKANCSATNSSSYSSVATITTIANCLTPSIIDIYYANTCSIHINWDSNQETAWQIEYGVSGFTLGTGTIINTSNDYYTIQDNIEPNTTYEVYVRANCGSEGYSDYAETLVVSTGQVNEYDLDNLFIGDYLIQDVNAAIGPNSGTENFASDIITLTANDSDPTKRNFFATILPGFTSGNFEVTLDIDTDSTIKMSGSIDPQLSCDGTPYIFTGTGADSTTFNVCGVGDYIVINYTEDPNGSCGGPFESSFSLTKQ